MYKYLRDLMDVADTIGDVENVCILEWGENEKRMQLEGKNADGKKFRLILECEVAKDGT